MDSISKTYEQFCIIKGHNVIIEEIMLPSGKIILNCTMKPMCDTCKNKILREQLENCKSFTHNN